MKSAARMYPITRRSLHICRSIDEFREARLDMVLKKRSLGFVPTMGALHAGHLALMDISKRENDFTAASIFVNPTQFSRGEDLDKYPRPLERDIEMLTAGKVDLLFLPDGQTMYP